MAYLLVEQTGIAQGSLAAVSVPTSKLNADGSNVMFRRVVSIAQTFREAYGTEYPDHPDRLQGYVLSQDSGRFSKVDLNKHNYGTSAAIFDCRLWTPTSQALPWDYTRLHPTKGLRWFPKGLGLDHVVWFSRKEQGQSGVLDNETVTIELRP